jgi:hypothetical protein
MFHLDVSKVDLVLHMLQWLYTYVQMHVFLLDVSKLDRMLHDIVAGGERPAAGLGSYLVSSSRGAPHPLLSSPSLPLPSLRLAVAVRAQPK